MTAKAGILSDVYIASLPSVAVVDETTTDVGTAGGAPLARQWYQITNAARRRIDKTVVPVVERSTGGAYSVVPASEYRFNYVLGRVEFLAQQVVSTVIRVDANYMPLTKLGGGHEWSADFERDVLDATEFGDTWRRKVVGVGNASGSIAKWWMDASLLALLQAGSPLVIVLYADYAANLRYEMYARLASESIESAVDSLVDEDLEFESDGEAYYATT